jgi:hypothetical protein
MPFPIEWFVLGALAGYAIGRLDSLIGLLRPSGPTPAESGPPVSSFFAKKHDKPLPPAPAPISIDETKVVSQVDTDMFQKVADTPLGSTTVVADDVNSAASRLAHLKGKL